MSFKLNPHLTSSYIFVLYKVYSNGHDVEVFIIMSFVQIDYINSCPLFFLVLQKKVLVTLLFKCELSLVRIVVYFKCCQLQSIVVLFNKLVYITNLISIY